MCAGFLTLYFFTLTGSPTLIVVSVILLFVVATEIIPTIIAWGRPEGILLVLFPVIAVLCFPWKTLYDALRRGGKPREENEESGEEEFRIALDEGEKSGAVESKERVMVEGVLYLGDRPVSAFMTHRSETEWLDINAGAGEARDKAIRCRSQGFFPVVRETQDDIAGVVSVQDILIALTGLNDGKPWPGLSAIMKKPYFIPETMSALKAFEAFQREEEYYLCVMDEYGGFAGSLRVRNLLEEIVGELTGSDAGDDALIKQEDGTWLADGSVNVDELAETLGLENVGGAAEGYHTLAGFILKLAGDIPKTGESFGWGGYSFKVVDKDGNRIDKVLISRDRE
jgi:putative hemolysin